MNEGFHIDWLACGPKSERYRVNAPGASVQFVISGYVFCWTSQGRRTHIVDDKSYTAGPGDIFLFRPGQVVNTESDSLESSLGHSISMGITALPADWPDPSTWPIKRTMPEDDVLRPLFEYVISNVPDNDVLNESPALESTIQAMVSIFLFGPFGRAHKIPEPYPASLQRVLAWIHELACSTIGIKVTLNDMAKVGGVSPKYLCRVFKKHLGYPPMEALYMYRLTRSLIGLRMGKKAEVLACEYGFSDSSHYARRFRALFGRPPEKMREDMAKGYKPKLPKLPHMTG